MAELLFKRGLHNNLPSASASIIDGAFYLTTDSHRLYAGIYNSTSKENELVDLNKSITTVANVETLIANNISPAPQDGDFAYAIGENVLAVYLGGQWKQINKNTNTTNAALTYSSTDGKTLTTTITDSEGKSIENAIVFNGASGITVSLDAAGNVTIDGVEYSLETVFDNNTFSVTLTNDKDLDETAFGLTQGTNVTFTHSNGNLTISAQDTVNAAASISANNEGDINLTITDSEGGSVNAEAAQALFYKVGAPGKEVTVYNQNSLNVYTIDEIDTKLNQLNAMKYMGTVSSDDDLMSKEAKAERGHTYMVAQGGTYQGRVAKIGDLFIATAGGSSTDENPSEDANGILTDVVWTYVPSGDDSQTDTQYIATASAPANGGLITVSDNLDGNVMMQIDLQGDEKIKLNSVASKAEADGATNILATSFSHAAPANVNAIEPTVGANHTESKTITVPSQFVIDSTGHVASYKEDSYTILGYGLSGATVSASNNVVTVTDTLTASDGGPAGTSVFKIDVSAADNLNATVSGNTITMKLEWGTF